MGELAKIFDGFCADMNLLWYALGVLVISDFATGICKAYKKCGGVSSSRLRDGGFKKAGILLVSLLGYGMSVLFSDDNMIIANGIISYYIYTELVSVIENLSELGVPLPPIIEKIRGIRKENEND